MNGETFNLELPAESLDRLEIMLKNQMVKELVAIQRKRAVGESPNVKTTENYVSHARALREVLKAQRERFGYKSKKYHDIRNLSVYPTDLYDSHRYDFDSHKTPLEIVDSLHKTGSEATVC